MRRTDRPGVRWEARNASGCETSATLDMINVHERTLFLAGTKLIAVISEAASAGISLHADKCAAALVGLADVTLKCSATGREAAADSCTESWHVVCPPACSTSTAVQLAH